MLRRVSQHESKACDFSLFIFKQVVVGIWLGLINVSHGNIVYSCLSFVSIISCLIFTVIYT